MSDSRGTIRFQGLNKRYRTEGRGEVWALRGLSLLCPAGELTCAVGASGCGKTTLLRTAAGMERATSGYIGIAGRPVTGVSDGLGMVSQAGNLLPWRKAIDNVALGLELRGLSRRRRHRAALATLESVGLDRSVARAYPHELSGGMRQRIALARALCPGPRVLLLDEPFAALDEPTRHRLQRMLLELHHARPVTALLVTHSISEAVFLADRVAVMACGRVVREVPVEISHPRDRLSEEFVAAMTAVRDAMGEGEKREGIGGRQRYRSPAKKQRMRGKHGS